MKIAKNIIVFVLAALPLLSCSSSDDSSNPSTTPHNYYIDAVNGSDSNDGLSADKAWKTISKVNSTTFQPADRILFKSGCEWTGQLHPKGSGRENNPIRIDKYGSGALPVISQGDQSGNVVLLKNQDQWEIRSLEIDGGSSKPDKQVGGIQVQSTTAGRVLNHIVISDCVIRNILGTIKQYESCAIWVGVPGWNSKDGLTTSFNDVLIENNKIYKSDRNGILVWTTAAPGSASQFQKGLIPSKNVIVRNNLLEDIGGDGILVLGSDKPLVERNVVRRCCIKVGDPSYGHDGSYNTSSAAIWLHHCSNGIMQYNAVYDCKKLEYNNDGMAYDFDFNCDKNLLQYNYSCNNAGGFLLIMNSATNNVVRYNISENDCSHVLYCVGSEYDMNAVYNNTFYNNSGISFIVPNARFYNNIFMADGTASISVQEPEKGLFKNNCYAGNWGTLPSDNKAVTQNPLFVNPGKGSVDSSNFAGYALGSNSPCLSKGMIISGNGGKDILGNNVSEDGIPDIGAVQHK
jgi:hypothetical protein